MSSSSRKKRKYSVHLKDCRDVIDQHKEQLLAEKLFGKHHDDVEESSDADDGTDQEIHSLWHDEDDVDDLQVPNRKSAVCLRRSTDIDGCVPAYDYQSRLRKVFQRKRGTPKWAKLASRRTSQVQKQDSDEEFQAIFDDMTKSCIRYVDKDPFIVKDLISSSRCPDITIGHHDREKINSVLFHHVRPVILTGGASGKVQLFEISHKSGGGKFLQNVQFSRFPITSMGLMQGGCSLVCGSMRQDYLMKYDLEKGTVAQLQLPKCIPRQNAGRFSLSSDGSLLAMIAHSSQSMDLVRTFSAPAEVTSLQFLPGSCHELWAMTECGEIIIWKVSGTQQVSRDNGAVRGTKIRLSIDGDKVACGSNTGIVNLYDTTEVRNGADPKPRAVVSNLLTSCDSIAFNHDCQLMAFSSSVKKNQVKLFHMASCTVFSNFPQRQEKIPNVECVEFSPHSAYLALGCSNGQLILERLNYFEDY
ncbi:hypothetical protein DICVIV_12901 [Dictyocaulus viviparus]|uniref:WD domain, G-beta repeat protein n=1 Tax=Dictyocaulus viviparus TaxID=29172 RepID=A0A0D8XBT4_DICVI|nr:hypothetical protein DICVIV_12901 [Dictyocaulus viviparus]